MGHIDIVGRIGLGGDIWSRYSQGFLEGVGRWERGGWGGGIGRGIGPLTFCGSGRIFGAFGTGWEGL